MDRDGGSDKSPDEKPKGRSGTRPKKRKFHGNQYSKETDTEAAPITTSEQADVGCITQSISSQCSLTSSQLNEPPAVISSPVSASRRKMRQSLDPEVEDSRKDWSGFRVVDIDLFLRSIESILVCKACFLSVTIHESFVCGLSSEFTVTCKNQKCGFSESFRNSIFLSNRVSEVNRRSVYAFKGLELGYSSYKEFSALMDFPKPVSNSTFDRSIDAINESCSKVAEESLQQAASEEVDATGNTHVTVSGDGSWQKRGFSSLFGVVTLIGLLTGKVLDFLVLSLVCKICDAYNGSREGQEYQNWLDKHAPEYTKNHVGSSGKMEVDGMVHLFKRSVSERRVIYKNYIGDGDSKTYKSIVESDPYQDKKITVNKRECTAHVQKRMGTRLRNLKKEMSGKKLSDGKPLSGKNRLTYKVIDQISQYYGNAIRSSNTVSEMKINVWAIYYHMSASDNNPSHEQCPTGADSWCAFQRAVTNKREADFKHKQGVPIVCMEACKKVFQDLTCDELLERCLGGYTQNQNESLNNLIWSRCPKVKFFGKKSVDIASADAVLLFNDGCRAKIKVMREMGLQPGNSCINWAIKEDAHRVTQAQVRAKQTTKEARAASLATKKATQQQSKDDSYVSGGH